MSRSLDFLSTTCSVEIERITTQNDKDYQDEFLDEHSDPPKDTTPSDLVISEIVSKGLKKLSNAAPNLDLSDFPSLQNFDLDDWESNVNSSTGSTTSHTYPDPTVTSPTAVILEKITEGHSRITAEVPNSLIAQAVGYLTASGDAFMDRPECKIYQRISPYHTTGKSS